MKVAKAILVGMVILVAFPAFAQDYPKWEVALDYSYVRGNPSRFGSTRSLNGGGGNVVYNFNQWFGIRGDFQGYGSTVGNLTIPAGSLPGLPKGGNFAAQGNLFTYMGGPQIRIPTHVVKPFADLLFGGAHSNLYQNLNTVAAGNITASPANDAFAMAVGVGFDVHLSKSIAIRPVEVDYLMTRFGRNLFGLSATNQNNFRYQGGIVFGFGE